MNIDYDFIKRILNTMQKQESHYISVSKLLEDAEPEYLEINKNDYLDLFYGHLHLLKDNKVIEEVLGQDLGCSYTINSGIRTGGCFIRLTSKGYDFIKILNKDGLTEKLKRLTVNESIKVAEAVLLNGITEYLGKLL